MDKENILEESFRALRVALNNAFSYSKDHPYFIKSAENFKIKLEETLSVLDPFKIIVGAEGLAVDGQKLSKSGLYDELAHLLHQRKIKTIEIRGGAGLDELVQFLSVISLPQKEILKKGGINAILSSQPLAHFVIEELDYSEFLRGQGKEINDVWAYMLKEAATSKNNSRLEALADDLGDLIKHSSQKDVFESEEIPASIGAFLASLKEKNKEKFVNCSKEIFLWLLKNKKSIKENDLEKLKPVFDNFDQNDFSELLWQGISQEENFDDLSLQLFSKISESKDPSKIAKSFSAGLDKNQKLKNNPHALKRIQTLLNAPKSDQVSAVYRNTLESLFSRGSYSGALIFDSQLLKENFRYIILNIFFSKETQENLRLAEDSLEKELPSMLEDSDTIFLKDLRVFLLKKNQEGPLSPVYADFEKNLSLCVENFALNHVLSDDQEVMLEMVAAASHESNYYLDKIFASGVNKSALILFFRFFPQNTGDFCGRLQEKAHDLDFMAAIIECLGSIGNDSVLKVLEFLYPRANELMKSVILKAMAKSKRNNSGFLLEQFSKSTFSIRKEIIPVLMEDSQVAEKAIGLLFNFPSFLGKKNNLLIENIQIVSDLKIKAAAGWLRILSSRKFPWNRQLRNKAKEALERLNV